MSAALARTSVFRAVWRASGFVLFTIFSVIVHTASRPFGFEARRRAACFWNAGAARLCGLKIHVSGEPVTDRSTLFAGNHVSYLDIPVLTAVVGAPFVAKSELSSWPVFGFLAKLGRTVFIDRKAVRAGDHLRAVAARLTAGESVFIFPEGTSSDGAQVLAFKSSLFGVFEKHGGAAPALVQPVSIAYPRDVEGRPLGGERRALYGWFGDATLMDHLLRVFAMKGACVEVVFHPPVSSADFPDRKALARHCEQAAAEGVRRLNAGLED
ncbi:MAG: lysophospholipid acyltransferase family protein [Rhodospirillales bacterium]